MEFAYQARDNEGMLRTGTVEASSETEAYDALQGHGLVVIKVFPKTKISALEHMVLFDRVSMKELVLFSRQLSTLINAKVPIVQSLNILKLQVSSHKLKAILDEVAEKVESGDSLSSSLALYPKVFSELYVNLVRSGELSGTLDEALAYLANQLEKDYDLRSKIIGALTYPAFIVFALFTVGFLMFIYVLPPLVSILTEAAVELPITTKILIAVTNIFQNYWWILLLVVVGGGLGLRYYSSTVGGRYVIDYLKLKIPIFGKLFRNIYMTRFARNLSTLIVGGIPIIKALDSVADIIGNKIFRDIILDASQQVKNGKTIASVLSQHPEFPPIAGQMTQIGEQTGKLQEILDKLANFYEKETEAMLRVLTTLIEPIIMILLGFAVAIMVAGILLPIYNLAGTV